MRQVAAAARPLTETARMRLLPAERRRLAIHRVPMDRDAAQARLAQLLDETGDG